jgi:integrase
MTIQALGALPGPDEEAVRFSPCLPIDESGTEGRPDSLIALERAAMMLDQALRDKTYQGSPLGQKVAAYLHWKEVEDGATPRTVRDYEAALARLALRYAATPVEAFDGDAGRKLVTQFWYSQWDGCEANTRRKILAQLRDFFRWLVRDDGALEVDPTAKIRTPRRREPERGELFSQDEQDRILAACERSRDRVAIRLLFDLGVRRHALRMFRLGDYDPQRGIARFEWKGDRIHRLPVPPGLASELADHIAERMMAADRHGSDWRRESLLYPEKVGPSWNPDLPKMRLLWEDRSRPLSQTGLYVWWRRRLDAARVPYRRMHDARHTALTDFWRESRDIVATQLMAGHKSIQTTADIYVKSDVADLAAALKRIHGEA